MKSRSESALARDGVWPAFEGLRRQTGRHASRLTGERTSQVKSTGRVAAGHDFDCTYRLRSDCLCGVQRILGGGGARPDLRHIKVAGEALLFAHISEFCVLLVNIERLLRVAFLLCGFDSSEVRARDRSGEG